MLEHQKINLAIMASGSGSNAQALYDFSLQDKCLYQIKLIITDQAEAYIINRFKNTSIPVIVIPYSENKKEHENTILQALTNYQVHWIALAGYMRLLSGEFIAQFVHKDWPHSKIFNIHPSLLPDFAGRDVYQRVFSEKPTHSGISIHYVDKGMDTGPIIQQEKYQFNTNWTLKEFMDFGLAKEHQIYPQCINQELRKYILTQGKNNELLL